MKHVVILCCVVFAGQFLFAQDPAYPVAPAAPGNITAAEYFIDIDPGFGNGTPITVSPSVDISNINFSANISALADGYHVLFIRSKDDWSITAVDSFLIGSPLPLRFLSFSGIKSDIGILLKWSTENEINTSLFDIERSSNGAYFVKTGEVASKNNNGKNEYSFIDAQPLAESNYYRLKQIDKDGRFKFSTVIKITNDRSVLLFSVFPNPANNFINIIYTGKKEMVTVRIYNLLGKLVKQERSKNELPVKTSLQQLHPGIYVIELSDGDMVQRTRFLKQ
ncbi:MAG: T9SS type A sorting domain-containing protein [Ferruginibacter sp.]